MSDIKEIEITSQRQYYKLLDGYWNNYEIPPKMFSIRNCSSFLLTRGMAGVQICVYNSLIDIYNGMSVVAHDSTVKLYDSSCVVAKNCEVFSSDKSEVNSYGRSSVCAYDSSLVRAYDTTNVRILSRSNTINRGITVHLYNESSISNQEAKKEDRLLVYRHSKESSFNLINNAKIINST